jgi:hypothetical protein
MSDNPISAFLGTIDKNQRWLAAEMGVADSLVSDWANDKRHPSLDNALKLQEISKGAVPATIWAQRKAEKKQSVAPAAEGA